MSNSQKHKDKRRTRAKGRRVGEPPMVKPSINIHADPESIIAAAGELGVTITQKLEPCGCVLEYEFPDVGWTAERKGAFFRDLPPLAETILWNKEFDAACEEQVWEEETVI